MHSIVCCLYSIKGVLPPLVAILLTTAQLESCHAAEERPPLSEELKRFQPPTDAKESIPFIYAVTASPSSRPTLPQNTLDGNQKRL